MDIRDFFTSNPVVAIAVSGGVDSSYLLYLAKKYASKVKAYFVRSAFQPEFEYEDAKRLTSELDVELKVLTLDILSDDEVIKNPSDRCYYCKKRIFSAIIEEASKDGFTVVIEGTNASDDISDRPGFKALQELNVRSPLREAGITKEEIRNKSSEIGLFTWDKPSYACLATRIKTGEIITSEKLRKIERCERYLMDLGLSDLRIRVSEDNARIELRPQDISLFEENRDRIMEELGKHFAHVKKEPEAVR